MQAQSHEQKVEWDAYQGNCCTRHSGRLDQWRFAQWTGPAAPQHAPASSQPQQRHGRAILLQPSSAAGGRCPQPLHHLAGIGPQRRVELGALAGPTGRGVASAHAPRVWAVPRVWFVTSKAPLPYGVLPCLVQR